MTTSPAQAPQAPVDDLLAALATKGDGLSSAEAEARLARVGPNQLSAEAGVPAWLVFLRQFQSPLIYVLLFAALLSFFVGKRFDPYVILGVVAINALIGFVQEHQAARALEALKRMTAPEATVLRDGEPRRIDARRIVPGDVLVLEEGDRIGADARVLAASELELDEAALTGESLPTAKHALPLCADAPIAEQANMVFMNTTVTHGRGRAVVVATGMACQIGLIAAAVAGVEATTPLQRRMARFSRQLGAVVLALVAAIAAVGLAKGMAVGEVVMLALAMAVSGIPEGLPIVITVVLAIGVSRMARRQALIRKLPAVEALGAATVIGTDKTGTLTHNALTVTRLYAGDGWYAVTGAGYAPTGDATDEAGRRLGAATPLGHWLAAAAGLCNNAGVFEAGGQWRVTGDPTDGALRVLAGKLGAALDWARIDEVPFASERKWMATLHRHGADEHVALVKGAPDRLLRLASGWMDGEGRIQPLDEAARARFEAAATRMGEAALRVLAMAMLPAAAPASWREGLGGGLVLLGLAGLADPPREEAIAAIARCKRAGIRVVMITGDHAVTARAIARQMGLARDGGEAVIEGAALARMGDAELAARVGAIDVFARVDPIDKLRIVRALQANGEIVAMTGDGVNDAPALKAADIGVSMGRGGTEVAKEAASMVLADDNFATIVAAVEEGRVIAANLRKVIQYLISASGAELAMIIAALLLGLPLPLVAAQILWINLVTDGLFDKTLALEKGEPDLMTRQPRSPGAGLFDASMVLRLVPLILTMAAGSLGLFAWALAQGASLDHARTLAFTTLVAFQWTSAFANRSFERRLLGPGFFANRWMFLALAGGVGLQLLAIYWPPLQAVFQTVPLAAGELALAVAVAASLLAVTELAKRFAGPPLRAAGWLADE